MTKNDIFRRIRFIFNFDDTTMMTIFGLVDCTVTRAQVSDWLKQHDNPAFQELNDSQLADFLNGLIVKNRGKKEGALPEVETQLSHNMVLRKLKIALDFKDNDILAALSLAKFALSKHELSALFRRPDHKNYRECQTQLLRSFLKGLQLKYRTDLPGGGAEPQDDGAVI